ncbi:MAG: prepilin-type N-terminal cleavage/methylation domain-containing protein [Firmicutes bacterium]|nr:prepilin-type N-terminal cleavage/methylation domain-containing protein [Bacillota bacterium]
MKYRLKPAIKTRGFSLIEVMIALAIALIMLTALLSLEIKSTELASRTTNGLDALPVAIEETEEISNKEITGVSEKECGEYKVVISSKEVPSGINMVRIHVEVNRNDVQQADLSLYKFSL